MSTPTLTSAIGDFALGFANQRPIYANGIKIGYWTPQNNLCGGNAHILNEFVNQATKLPTIDPRLWVTKDDLWRDVPVSEYCIKKGIVPTWASVTAARTAVTMPNGEVREYTRNEVGAYEAQQALKVPLNLALIGGVGIVALLFLRR
jgi:hypothetical protein